MSTLVDVVPKGLRGVVAFQREVVPQVVVKAATSLDSTTCTKSSSGGKLSNK